MWCIHGMIMAAQLFPGWIPHHYSPLFCLPFSPLCTILLLFISPLRTFVLPAFFTLCTILLSFIYRTTTHLCFTCLFTLIYISHHYTPLFCLPFYPHLHIAPLHTVLPAFLPSFIYHTTTHLRFASLGHHYVPFYSPLLGKRERTHLVVQPARIFYILYIHVSVRHTTVYLVYRSATGKRKAGSLQVQRSPILPPYVSQYYARLRFSATRDTTSSTDNHCPSALQRCQGLLNGTLYGNLRVSHRPAMCVSLSMNVSCCASVLPSTHDYAYRACDTSITPLHTFV